MKPGTIISDLLAGRLVDLKLFQLPQARKMRHDGWQAQLQVAELLRGCCAFLGPRR